MRSCFSDKEYILKKRSRFWFHKIAKFNRRTKKFKLNLSIEFVRERKIMESLVMFHAQKDGIEMISSRLAITPRWKNQYLTMGQSRFLHLVPALWGIVFRRKQCKFLFICNSSALKNRKHNSKIYLKFANICFGVGH